MLTRDEIGEWREELTATGNREYNESANALCDMALAVADGEEVYRVIPPPNIFSGRPYFQTEKFAWGDMQQQAAMTKAEMLKQGWTVQRFKLVREG